VEGAIYQMLNHGLSTGGLFLLVGVIYERRHTRMISDFGGLTKSMPIFATVFMIVTLSSIGLPLTNGFVGEFLILLGVFAQNPLYGVLAATGVVLGAIYMLWMLQRVFFGPIKDAANEALKDLSVREITVFAPIIGLIFFMGVYPKPFLSRMEPAVKKFVTEIKAKQMTLDNSREIGEPLALSVEWDFEYGDADRNSPVPGGDDDDADIVPSQDDSHDSVQEDTITRSNER
jgi:NADH-quinone oxidoreductase subunit M